MSGWISQRLGTRARGASRLLPSIALLCFSAACADSGEAGTCHYQSSSSSGGICRLDLRCEGYDLAASCTDVDCVCLVDGAKTGQTFAANGLCATPLPEQIRQVETRCAPPAAPADGGASGDGQVDPRCPPKAYTGMACGTEALGATCAGAAACFCNGPVNIATTCVCEEGAAFGRVWRCDPDCKSACEPDAGVAKPDQGASGNACVVPPQCIESTTGSASSITVITSMCTKLGGTRTAACSKDHHDQCLVASQEVVIYTDKTIPQYDPYASQHACSSVGGSFTP